jgi:hypothetical protein
MLQAEAQQGRNNVSGSLEGNQEERTLSNLLATSRQRCIRIRASSSISITDRWFLVCAAFSNSRVVSIPSWAGREGYLHFNPSPKPAMVKQAGANEGGEASGGRIMGKIDKFLPTALSSTIKKAINNDVINEETIKKMIRIGRAQAADIVDEAVYEKRKLVWMISQVAPEPYVFHGVECIEGKCTEEELNGLVLAEVTGPNFVSRVQEVIHDETDEDVEEYILSKKLNKTVAKATLIAYEKSVDIAVDAVVSSASDALYKEIKEYPELLSITHSTGSDTAIEHASFDASRRAARRKRPARAYETAERTRVDYIEHVVGAVEREMQMAQDEVDILTEQLDRAVGRLQAVEREQKFWRRTSRAKQRQIEETKAEIEKDTKEEKGKGKEKEKEKGKK